MTEYGIPPGTIVGDDFEIVRPLTSGGMGSIFVARQRSIGVLRALKLMNAPIVQNAEMRERFVREARIGASIGSDHVVQVINAGVDRVSGLPWIALELLEGGTLQEQIAQRGPLPSHEVVTIWMQLCAAMAAAHEKNIVHRDLKPENIFLAKSRIVGVPVIVKVLDFGIAKIAAENVQNTLQAGSPLYMAPEQTSQAAVITQRTDVWALGLIAFMLLVGKHFWSSAYLQNPMIQQIMREAMVDAIPPASVRAAEYGLKDRLPPGFDDWFSRCVARQPEGRFRDARAAGDELLRLLGSDMRISLVPTIAPPPLEASGRVSAPGSGDRISVPSSGDRTPTPQRSSASDVMATSEYLQQAPAPQIHHTPIGPPPVQPAPLAPTADYAMRTGNTASSTIVPQRSRVAIPIAIGGVLVAAGIAYLVFGRGDDGGSAKADPTIAIPGQTAPAATATSTAQGASSASPPEGMIAFAGGTVQLPADPASGSIGREVKVGPFALDHSEVTTASYQACVSSGKCGDAAAPLTWKGAVKAAADKWSGLCNARAQDRGNHPINCVTWDQADAYCQSAGKRLPTEAEWEIAARGDSGRPNPWGSAALTTKHANLCDGDCVKLAAEVQWTWQPFIDGSDGYAGTAPVGSFKDGDSPEGVHDLMGNVAEWTSSHPCDGSGPECQDYQVVGGGFLTARGDPLRKHSEKSLRTANVGFRCAISR